MKILCMIDVTASDYGPVTVQVEESHGVLSLREVRRGEVQGAQIEAAPELGLVATRRGWSDSRSVVVAVREP